MNINESINNTKSPKFVARQGVISAKPISGYIKIKRKTVALLDR